jgi:quercetin 2,3-dioxygenase
MRAGTGVTHSEHNHSETEPVHFLQIWILPEEEGLKPAYGQRSIDQEAARSALTLVASRGGREDTVSLKQDADLFVGLLSPGERRAHPLRSGRHAWLQVARGQVELDGLTLRAGDGASLSGEPRLELSGKEEAEVLVFDLG